MSVTTDMVRPETSVEGYTLHKLYDLTLVREQHPAFLFGWTLIYIIDETRPLFGSGSVVVKAVCSVLANSRSAMLKIFVRRTLPDAPHMQCPQT